MTRNRDKNSMKRKVCIQEYQCMYGFGGGSLENDLQS